MKKVVLENFAKFTGKHLWFAKFSRAPLLQNTSGRLPLAFLCIFTKMGHCQQCFENFPLAKICEKYRKDHNFVCFRMFPFHGYIMFSEISFKRICKKAASFRKCVFSRKYEIFLYDSLT